MPLSLDEIKTLESVDLESFEIRGAKPGIGNANTTGTVYTQGSYVPDRNELFATGTFLNGDSTITGISFNTPYGFFTAGDLIAGDTISVEGSSYTIKSSISSTSAALTAEATVSGTFDSTYSLAPRDYLVEPDVQNNTVTGIATFTTDSTVVTGSTSSWLTSLAVDDVIKHDAYQQYFKITQVVDNTTLYIETPYSSDTTTGLYKAKRVKLNQMFIRYTKDEFTYEKNGGYWEVTDETTGSGIPARSTFYPLADGLELKFSPSVDSDAFDLMDSNVAKNVVLTQKTQRELFQYPLPKVPSPEDSLEVLINDSPIDRFPHGNRDYVVNYSQDPVYVSPPAPEDRVVANLMFLNHIEDQVLPISSTATGFLNFIDDTGNNILGILPGSETITFDGTHKDLYDDYVFEGDAGIAYASSPVMNEKLVSYIGKSFELFNYGFSATLNGKELQYSVPPQTSDEIRVVLDTGRVIPDDKEKPAPNEEYIIDYQVAVDQVTDEPVTVTQDMTAFSLTKYPIKDNSLILFKNGSILDEGEEYRVSTQTGRVVLFDSLEMSDTIAVSYIPLSKRINGITYERGMDFCTTYGSRMFILNSSDFILGLSNYSLDPSDVEVLRIYNDTKNRDYDLSGISKTGGRIQLTKNSTNLNIGLSSSDIVYINYKFQNEGLEYFPVELNNYTVYGDSSHLYIPSQDRSDLFQQGSVVRLIPSAFSSIYFFQVKGSLFDGVDTDVELEGVIPEDIVNPSVVVTDSSVVFTPVDYTASAVMTGSSSITFSGVNDPYRFRSNAALKIGADLYGIEGASYSSDTNATTVTLTSNAAYDYTSTSVLTSLSTSDSPIYGEGDTEITTDRPYLDLPIPGFDLSYSSGTAYLTTDDGGVTVATDSSDYRFPWDDYQVLSDLMIGFQLVPGLTSNVYAPDWTSSRMTPVVNKSVWYNSSTLFYVEPTLKKDGTVTNNYDVEAGLIILDDSLVVGDTYHFDYLGQNYLGNTEVKYSADYFVNLPAPAKITASFEYENLDQFYVQVLSQRQFLEQVIEPRVAEESNQLAGGVGQGGVVTSDENQGNSEGGLVNDEFRRKDTEIECRVFKSIYDYFSDRLDAFSDEYYAFKGYKFCNNDGLLSEADQSSVPRKAFSRLWPRADYTNMEPYPIPPLTGQTRGPGLARFTNGSNIVIGRVDSEEQSTIWSYQFQSGDLIWPASNDSKKYTILTVSNDSQIVLTENFSGTSSVATGETFVGTSNYPKYDDDGYMGPRIIGTETGKPGLSDGDLFDATINGVAYSYKFESPTLPPFIAAFFGVRRLTLEDAARILTAEIDPLVATVEWGFNDSATYGYVEPMVLRVNTPNNTILLGNGQAVSKLGFTPGSTATGNLDPNSSGPEIARLNAESSSLNTEITFVNQLEALGALNKLDRTNSTAISLLSSIESEAQTQATEVSYELIQLDNEQDAQLRILEETSSLDAIPTTRNQTQVAYNEADAFIPLCQYAYNYDTAIVNNWQGKIDATNWAIDLTYERQYVRGLNASGIVVDTTGVTPITGQVGFILEAPQTSDRRFLDTTTYYPIARFEDSDLVVEGNWTGWDNGVDVNGNYSLNNTITFAYNSNPFIYVTQDPLADKTGTNYIIDSTSLNILWTRDGTPEEVTYPYSTYSTIGSLKTAINTEGDFIASGSATHDASTSALKIDTGLINYDATFYSGLRPLYVDYYTISDRYITDRDEFIVDRLAEIADRLDYLINTRQSQIPSSIRNEEILQAADGDTGSIYTWANVRFNRTQGCGARLYQQEQLIARNQSALQVNQPLL